MQLTVREVAKYLNVTEKTVYRWISEGRMPHHQVDGQYRFNRTELLEWAQQQNLKVSTAIYRRDNIDRPIPTIAEALEAGGIHHRLPGHDKTSVLRAMVDVLPLPDRVDRDMLYEILLVRERMGSTGIGRGIAIPHVRSPIVMAVVSPMISLFFLENRIDFAAPDGQPVRTLISMISPSVQLHAHMLARTASLIKDQGFFSALDRQAPTAEILNEARRAEAEMSGVLPKVEP